MPRLTLRRAILNIHLYVGLVAAPILVAAGLSGVLLGLRFDLDRWLHPALYRVVPAPARISQRDLLALVVRAKVPGGDVTAIEGIEFGDAGTARLYDLNSGAIVFVNPYNGKFLGTRSGPTKLDNFLDGVHQFHVRLLSGNIGQWVVDVATLLLVLMVPSGVILWWNKKRLGVRVGANWRQINWDLHNVIGIYGGIGVFVLALSGVLLAWEQPLYWMAHAFPERERPLPHSVLPVPANADTTRPGDVDAWLAAADRALPGQPTYQLLLPATSRSAVQIVKHGPGGIGRSKVFVDRYDAHVLRVDDIATGSRAYRAHVINRALHTGEIWGWPTRVLSSLASLIVVTLAVTGFILWIKRIVR